MNVSIIFCLLMTVFAVAMYNAKDNQRKQPNVVDSQLHRAPVPKQPSVVDSQSRRAPVPKQPSVVGSQLRGAPVPKQPSVVGSQLRGAPMTRKSLSNQRAASLQNRKKLEQGLDALSKWLPNDSQHIKTHKQEIIESILKNKRPSANSPIHQIGRETIPINIISASDNFTPCEMACGTVAVDGIFFLMGLMDLRVKNNEVITKTVMRKMGGKTLNGFSAQIHNFEHAGNALEKAKALLPIMGRVFKADGFSTAFKAVKSQLSTMDHIKAGVLMATQVGIWFGTDGAAFVTEVALSVMNAETVIQDATKAKTACPPAG